MTNKKKFIKDPLIEMIKDLTCCYGYKKNTFINAHFDDHAHAMLLILIFSQNVSPKQSITG